MQTQQSAYTEKAQQIKASYTPTLQPTSPTLSSYPNQQPTSYPKPNYNVNLGGQPVQYAPQYNNAPVVYGNMPYHSPPPAQYSQPQQQQQQQQQVNPFL